MNCKVLKHKQSALNSREKLLEEGIIPHFNVNRIVSPIAKFDEVVGKMNSQAQRDYQVNIPLYTREKRESGDYYIVPNKDAFDAIDNKRKELGIFDSQESFGSYWNKQVDKLYEEPDESTFYQKSQQPYIKNGVTQLFESNAELASIGTEEQYSQYLDSIFPDSKVKDIVYHGTTSKEKFEKFKLKYGEDESFQGFYFADTKFQSQGIAGKEGRVFPVILNANPKIGEFGITATKEDINQAKSEGYNALREEDITRGKNFNTTIVFEPEQIHILGSKQDIEGFKKFVQNTQNQLNTSTVTSKASKETLDKVKEFLERNGFEIKTLTKETGINGFVNILDKLIGIAQGKEDVALPEEAMHVVVEMLEQNYPKLFNQMFNSIGSYEIYKKVFEEYKDVYKTKDGKPDIRKIKKEAIGKVLTEYVILQNEGFTEKPENLERVKGFWASILEWLRSLISKTGNPFEAAAEMFNQEVLDESLKGENETFYQLNPQEKLVKDLKETSDKIEKVYSSEKTDPILLDTEEANNWYEIRNADGSKERILKRVTDRVKAWYKSKFSGKVFSEAEKKFNELKRKYGVEGHADFEEIHSRYYDSEGNKRDTPLPRPNKTRLDSEAMYEKLENYYVELINSFPKGTKVLSEVIIYDNIEKEAGTIDFLAIEPSGKVNILDWKFMFIKGDDVAWFKNGAFNIQLGTYKKILRERYGVKEFGKVRAIPISMNFSLMDKEDKNSIYLSDIGIGEVNPNAMTPLKLLPISEESESTGFKEIDNIVSKLNALVAKIAKEKTSSEEERLYKIERLNNIRKATKLIQTTTNIKPLIDIIEVLAKEGQMIINDYNAIYKDKPVTSDSSNNKQLSDFSDKMNNYISLAESFSDVDTTLQKLIWTKEMQESAKTENEKEIVAQRKEILNKLRDEVSIIRASKSEIFEASKEFADKFIGQKNLVTGLLSAEAVLKGLASNFRGVSELGLKALSLLYKLVTQAKAKASQEALTKVQKLMEIREKLSKDPQFKQRVFRIFQKDSNNKFANKLIYQYKREFFDQVDKLAEEGGNKQWLMDNIDVEAYKAEAAEIMKKRIEKIENNLYAGTEEEIAEKKEMSILNVKRQFDIDRKDFNGWNNYVIKRHPLNKWFSEEYKSIQADKELFELYNFIRDFNEEAESVGYISGRVSKTFLPFVRKSVTEKLIFDGKLSVLENFRRSMEINADDIGYGKIDELTGKLQNAVPKYYTVDFTKKSDGTNDYSDVSEDVFKNMILYIQEVEKYKYLTEIEGQLKLVKTIEENKNHLATSRSGDLVYEDGKLKELKGNEENAKIYDDFMRTLLYGQKYVLSDSDTPLYVNKLANFFRTGINKIAGKEVLKPLDGETPQSMVKLIDAANKGFQMKTLGLNLVSGAVNMFGGNIQMLTQAGNYFGKQEWIKNELKLLGQSFKSEEDKEIFVQAINKFMPLAEDPNYEYFKEAGFSSLTRRSLGDDLFFMMRLPEQLMEKTTFLTLLENTMIENGKIVSIREFVKAKYAGRSQSAQAWRESKDRIEREINELKETRAISKTMKLVDGKLDIPGLDLNNIDEVNKLTRLTRTISRNAIGSMSDGDINRMSMSIWTKSMMLFKNWIPKLTDTRFSEFRKIADDFSVVIGEDGISQGEKYDIGRLRLLGYTIGTSIRNKSMDIINIIEMNEKGIEAIDKMYLDFATKYKKRTGQDLNMSKDDFADMIRTNLRNQIQELAVLTALLAASLSLGFFRPDDDDDKATKNFFRYSQRVLDKFVDELSFFYNPLNYEALLSGSLIPATGVITDLLKFTSHFVREVTGFDITNPDQSYEEVRKKALPIKYMAKMFPVTKEVLTYLAIIDSDFAKEYDITIQKESSRR